MKEYPKYVAGSPFDKAQKAALEFAIRLHEEVIFKNLYENPDLKESAVNYLLSSPWKQEDLPN